MSKLRSAGVLVMLSAAVQAQSIHDSYGTEEFNRAFFEEKTGEVSFEPFQKLNWEAKARTGLPWLNFDHVTPAQVARMSSFEAAGPLFRSVDFRAPLDPAVNRASYLLISPAGLVPLQPVQLKGSVDLDFERDMTTVHKTVFSGHVVAKPARPVNAAAFVIVGKPDDAKDVDPAAKVAKRQQAGYAVYDLTDGANTITWTPAAKEESEVASALSFRLADRRFLLVKWKSGLCSSAYTLFSIGTELAPIADNDYDCDH